MPSSKNSWVVHARMRRRAAAAAPLALLALAPTAHAAVTGGAAPAGEPEIIEYRCPAGDGEATCPRGEVLRLSGENLRETRTVVFLGGKGSRDDRRATPTTASPHRVLVRVPKGARSGRVRVISRETGKSKPGPKLKVLAARRVSPASYGDGQPGVFPVRGSYDFGTHTNEFGGGRGHEGQDILAKCGVPVANALSGEVQHVAYHSRAGNYVVVQADDGTSQAYMHLRDKPDWDKGDAIKAGEEIGRVGRTGRASACHLHFELWTAPGWYLGGKPIDPLPLLKQWAQRTAES